MRTLLWLMLKEELRTHTTYSGRRFYTFPFVVMIFAFVFVLTMDRLLVETSLGQMTVLAHASSFLYGIGVGSFGFMGRQYIERRYGMKNYLVTMPSILPITYRQTFLGLYIRDSVFYVVLVLLPATIGLLAAAPIMGFRIESIMWFFVAIVLSFQLGSSLSFLGSVLYNRGMIVFIAFTLAVICLILGAGVFQLFDVQMLLPTLEFQFSVPPYAADYGNALSFAGMSALMIVGMTALSVALVRFHFTVRDVKYESLLPRYIERLSLAGKYREIVAKEFVDLRRSGTVGKMFFSYILPLMFLSFTSWFVNTGLGIEVGFNTVFYAAMVGFLGVLLYSWLNNVDSTDYYSLLPITVPELIRARLQVFLILTLGISTVFVVTIAAMNNELDILWLALLVMFVTSVYMVVMTAYLTGIRTNTFLFDMDILGKFAIMSFLPDVGLTILSFSIRSHSLIAVTAIISVLAILIGTTYMLYRGIERKWGRTGFDT